MYAMELFACEISEVFTLLIWSWILNISSMHLFCSHIFNCIKSVYLTKLFSIRRLWCKTFFYPSYLSHSSLQAGCSSGTQIRSTLPFAWLFFFTTQAPMHRRPPSTWYPMWTTLRRPTASPWPMLVSWTAYRTLVGDRFLVDGFCFCIELLLMHHFRCQYE